MYALHVVYNPSNPHLALGPVCIPVADSECCAPIYICINTDITLLSVWGYDPLQPGDLRGSQRGVRTAF